MHVHLLKNAPILQGELPENLVGCYVEIRNADGRFQGVVQEVGADFVKLSLQRFLKADIEKISGVIWHRHA